MFTRFGNRLVLVWPSEQNKGMFVNNSANLWLISSKDFFPSVRSSQHLASSSSFRNKIGPQPDDTSSLIVKQFKMCNTLQLLWIWIRYSSQSLANIAQNPSRNLFARFSSSESQTSEKERSRAFMYAGYETVTFCSVNFIMLFIVTNKLTFFHTNLHQNKFVVRRAFPANIQTTLIFFFSTCF